MSKTPRGDLMRQIAALLIRQIAELKKLLLAP
jgi:hypothetical protein